MVIPWNLSLGFQLAILLEKWRVGFICLFKIISSNLKYGECFQRGENGLMGPGDSQLRDP